jgi:hypothetical protein
MKSSHAGKTREYQNDQTSHRGPVSVYTLGNKADNLTLSKGVGKLFSLDNCQPYRIPASAGMTDNRLFSTYYENINIWIFHLGIYLEFRPARRTRLWQAGIRISKLLFLVNRLKR